MDKAINQIDGLVYDRNAPTKKDRVPIYSWLPPRIRPIEYSLNSLNEQGMGFAEATPPDTKQRKSAALRDLDRVLFALSRGPKTLVEISELYELDKRDSWYKSVSKSLKDGALRDLGFFERTSRYEGGWNSKLSLTLTGIMLAIHRFRPIPPKFMNYDFSDQHNQLLDELAKHYSAVLPHIFGKWDILTKSRHANVFAIFDLTDPLTAFGYMEYSSFLTHWRYVHYKYDRLRINSNRVGLVSRADDFEATFYINLLHDRHSHVPMEELFHDADLEEYCRFIVDLQVFGLNKKLSRAKLYYKKRIGDYAKRNDFDIAPLSKDPDIVNSVKLSDDTLQACKKLKLSRDFLRKLSMAVNCNRNPVERDKLRQRLPSMSKRELNRLIGNYRSETVESCDDLSEYIMHLEDKQAIVDSIFHYELNLMRPWVERNNQPGGTKGTGKDGDGPGCR